MNALKSIPDGEYEAAPQVREALIDAGVDDFGDDEFESIYRLDESGLRMAAQAIVRLGLPVGVVFVSFGSGSEQ